ncbi:MAG: sialate O-acetylesterase [Pirellulaceae bacterium]|nr:sialate O-acetylesterase [Pirellulaceae bacterium]
MKQILTLLTVCLLNSLTMLFGADLVLTSPMDYQVVQRSTPSNGTLRINGQLSEQVPVTVVFEGRILHENVDVPWHRLDATVSGQMVTMQMEAEAGGWWQLEIRVLNEGQEIAKAVVAHVGIGEVFVVAGQSNSANHGEEKLTPQTGRVAAFDGTKWQIANDPQPGASGEGGSFIPAFGDAVVEKLEVPVGIVSCGIGATSVREWLPKGSRFPNPPTLVSRVEQLPNGDWASDGAAFEMFTARMKQLGPNGFRAVLWHQGESDANQQDPSRTLSGKLYRESLEKLIRESRLAIGWNVPWFVAQVSYHVPGDESSPDIRAAQASLWKDGIAFEGPDSDSLKGELRERNGQGVHFSGQGLRQHGKLWAEKVLAWVEGK